MTNEVGVVSSNQREWLRTMADAIQHANGSPMPVDPIVADLLRALLATTAQQQDEPVAWSPVKPSAPGAYWVRGNGLDQDALIQVIADQGELRCNLHQRTTEADFGWGYAVSDLSEGFEWLGPLFTLADAGEVERLRAEEAKWRRRAIEAELAANKQTELAYDLNAELAQCGAMAAMIAKREWAEHAGTGPVSSKVEAAFTQLHNDLHEAGEKLAERDVLLREVAESAAWGIADLRMRIEKVLSASEEPSAPNDCAICRNLGDQCMECEEGEFREWADRHFAAADYRKNYAGVFIQDWMRHAYAAWCARAALERKS